MDLGAFQPATAMIFHIESDFAVEHTGFLRPDPEKYRIFSGKFPENFRENRKKHSEILRSAANSREHF